mmetsp:Transcript_3528/g.12587  ORF Transcript_3528/g.12587 Transcript_3528/m.12587 type:complete len:264 (-) Transcript_3528:338-1129(-)
MTMANEYTSALSVTLSGLRKTSGAVQGNVPRRELTPDTNEACERRRLDKPKSHTLHTNRRPLTAANTLSDFKSKWTNRFACKYSIPLATSKQSCRRVLASKRERVAVEAATFASNSACKATSPFAFLTASCLAASRSFARSRSFAKTLCNDPPLRNSSTIPGRSPSVTTPKIETTFGWLKVANVSASRKKCSCCSSFSFLFFSLCMLSISSMFFFALFRRRDLSSLKSSSSLSSSSLSASSSPLLLLLINSSSSKMLSNPSRP